MQQMIIHNIAQSIPLHRVSSWHPASCTVLYIQHLLNEGISSFISTIMVLGWIICEELAKFILQCIQPDRVLPTGGVHLVNRVDSNVDHRC